MKKLTEFQKYIIGFIFSIVSLIVAIIALLINLK